MRAVALTAALILFPSLLPAFQPADLDNLYQSNQWFEFRDAMLKPNPSAFYGGQLALAFHDWAQAEKEFLAVIKSNADPARSFEAALGLLEIYTLSGRRKDGRALLSRMDQLTRGGAMPQARKQFDRYRADLEALSGYPDEAVAARGSSRIYYAEIDNHLVVPVTVNGSPANYMLDTGAQSSTVSEGEAKRLGLTVHPVAVALDTISEHPQEAVGQAVATDLTIGNFHLRNVVFLVTHGDEETGIIGIDVILAFQTLRWNSDGTMEFGFPAAPRNLRDSNLSLAGSVLLTRGQLGDRNLNFILDTGSFQTALFPRFARDFPGQVANPLSVGPRDVGNDVTDPRVTTLPDVELQVGGLKTHLAPAQVLSRDILLDTMDAHGLLGLDLPGQARSVTLDFAAMKLTLDGIVRPAGACNLPPDFLCASGFSCQVKLDDTGPCFVNRVPVEPWKGNAVTSERADGNNCTLSAGANCPPGMLCRAIFDSNQSCHIEALASAPASIESSAIAPPIAAAPKAPLGGSDARDIVRRWLKYDSLDGAVPRDYVYLEDEETQTLNKDGTVSKTETQTREVMNLYDGSYSRLIRKNGEDLSPEKARSEQARFDKAVGDRAHETPAAKAKRQDAERKADAERLVCEAEFFTVFDARVTGTENVNGRPVWIVELDPRPKAVPHCDQYKIFSKFHVKAWIDQQEYRDYKVEADNIAPVTWGAFLVRFPTGGLHVESRQQRHAEGLWLPSQLHVKVNVKALLFVPFRVDVVTTYSGFRKFQADSRILPVGGN